ncbi:MAG TPA: patatin-like phospholipase family protein [Pyrinomonadaceae bacterium]|nr:patatin-like phospholipase family protein [Pyrinomonadaceae bacterium]
MPDKLHIPLHLFEIMEEEYVNLYGQPPGAFGAEADAAPNAPPPASDAAAARRNGIKVWLPDRGGVGTGAACEAAGRTVMAGRDWYFRPGHLIDPAGLAAEILPPETLQVKAAGAAAAPSHIYDEWAKKNLREYLFQRMDRKVLEDAAGARQKFKELRRELFEARRVLAEAAKSRPEREAELRKLELASGDVDEEARKKLDDLSARLESLDASIPDLRKRLAELQSSLDGMDEALRRELDKLLDNRGLYSGDRFPSEWLTSAAMIEGLVSLHERASLEGDSLRQLNRLLLERAFPKYVERIHHIRVAAAVEQFHARRPTALSLSGGGIRSGTFALGLLQGLARHDLLKRFDYLSTVSGGGYVGAWLTAWLSRHPEGLEGVTRDLANQGPVSKIDPDPRPIQYLREYSNFLTPKAGALTADTWSFVGIYLRNLLLNWGVFLPLFLAVLMLPRILLTYTLYQPTETARPAAEVLGLRPEQLDSVPKMKEVPEHLRVVYQAEPYSWGRNFFDKPILRSVFWGGAERDKHLYPRHLLLPLGFLFGVWALGYVGFNRPGLRETLRERSKFWRDRSDQRSFLWACLMPLILSALLLTTYWAWTQEASSAVKGLGYFLVFGLAFTIGGSLIASLVLRRWRWRGAWRFRENSLREFLSVIGAGLLAGLLFWVLAAPLGDPIKGYGIGARKVGEGSGPLDWAVTSAPLAWTDWTSWHWWNWTTELYICLAVPFFLLVFWTGVTIFVGLTSWNPKVSDEDREWWARFGAWLLIASIVWVVLSGTVIFGPLVLLQFPKLLAAVGGVSGLVAVLVGKSSLTPARSGASDEKDKSKAGAASRLLAGALPLFGLVFLLSVAAGLSLLTTGITRWVALKAAEVCQSRLDNFDASVRLQGWGWDYKVSPHALEEAITNVPSFPSNGESARPTPSPLPTPYDGFGVGLPRGPIDSYSEFITPVVPKLAAPVVRPSPLPGSTLCTPACPSPAEADAEIVEHTADDYVGAGIVHMNVLHHTSHWFTIALAALLFVVGLLLSWLMNLNYFSLHGGYRNRLIRAFLGASRPPGQRKPNPFTGFDPSDNMSMHELRPALLDEDDILDQTALYEELLNQSNPMSKYLTDQEMLASVENEPSSTPSPSLVHALRTDLNAILESEALDKLDFAEAVFEKGRARRIRESIMAEQGSGARGGVRGSYRVLLNRLVLESFYPEMLRPCSYPPPPYKLLHVINTSLNLVGGEKLAWQQRKAEPFSVTPLHSGCFRLGYRRSRLYGGKDTGGISIGTAAAISGAAASSNMGYYTTSPIISLLLTLFNVRLGWWLGNPGPAGQKTYELANPTLSVAPVLYEAFGLTNDRYKYVYLTDGGHFENLALYEMVLRRCHLVVVSDAAADGDYRFGDLGNAVRKIRIDLGVPIEFQCFDIYGWDAARARESKGKPSKGMYWAVGRIRYSCVDKAGVDDNGMPVAADDGIIIYVKPALYGDEPRDVLEYRENFPAFPHQSTGDQFFDEPQFESYRALGSHVMDRMCGSAFEPLDLYRMAGLAFSAAREHCPDVFKGLGGGTEMPDPKIGGQALETWLKGIKDAGLRNWLGELARGEGFAHDGAARHPPPE